MTERWLAAETSAESPPLASPLPPPCADAIPPNAEIPALPAGPPAAPKCPNPGPPPLAPFIAVVATSASTNGAAPNIVDATDAENVEPGAWQDIWVQVPSWLTSTAVHLSIVIVLALLTTTKYVMAPLNDVSVSADGTGTSGDGDLEGELMQSTAGLDQSADRALSPPELGDLAASGPLAEMIGSVQPDLANPEFALKGIGGEAAPGGVPGGGSGGDAGGGIGDGLGNSLELRLSGPHREGLLRSGGGTPESEKAVAMALHWLAEHQNYDGSWTFAHQKSPKCHGSCRDPGYAPGKIAATSLALLPFLGTGQTHKEGQYRRTIDLGLKFLVRSMELDGKLGSLFEPGGQMYGHGLAAIVLCEAYGMTHDVTLQAPAQASINFIVEAQDPLGGGWRYMPRQPGDTSVVGWQLMALKSAQLAYLRVPPMTMRKADYFLDHVQGDRGATYGYTGPELRRPSTSAIGLLCRMYLGWKRDMQPLERGVQILGTLGPSTNNTDNKNNMYYNYYATQVMHHWGGYPWQRWNEVMREYLIKSQTTRGHETGSWFLDGTDHGTPAGGRLYCTAMAAMTLEVYYRYMPLYRPQSIQ